MDDDDQGTPTGNRTAGEDLAFLVAEGLRDNSLEQCVGLGEIVLHELALAEPISPGTRIILLNKALQGAISEHRLEAFEHHEEGTAASAATKPPFQVAAAGELLGLTDEAMFDVVRTHRCKQKGVTWEALRAKDDNKGAAAEKQLRAAIWVGGISARSMAADRQGLKQLAALESAIKVYARQHRTDLLTLIADDTESSAEPVESPTAPLPAPDPPDEPDPARARRLAGNTYVRIAVGVVVAASVTAGVLALTNDDSGDTAKSGPSAPKSAPSSSGSVEVAGPQRIEDIPPCSSLSRDSQWAKDLRSRKQVVIDGRCYPDPTLNVGGQVGPSRDTADQGEYSTGQILNNICLKSGQVTADMVGSKTTVWVRFDLDADRQAFVSAIWAQGEDGAEPC